MTAVKIAVFAIVGVMSLLLLKENSSAFTVVARCTLVIVILFSVIPEIKTLIETTGEFKEFSSSSNTALKILFKSFAILTVGSVGADICRDNGENAVAATVELAVKILAVSCALPVFTAVAEIAAAFFNR